MTGSQNYDALGAISALENARQFLRQAAQQSGRPGQELYALLLDLDLLLARLRHASNRPEVVE